MAYYVYILQSEKDNSFYKGFSQNPYKRLDEHNAGFVNYTRGKTPWNLVYLEQCPDKTSALIREKNLKKADRKRIEALISNSKNIVTK